MLDLDTQTVSHGRSTDLSGMSSDDPRVVIALEEFLELGKRGQIIDREEFLERHFEIAEALADALEGLEWLDEVAEKLSSTGKPPIPDQGLPPATRLGEYQIIREVGRGGMGVVYEAAHIPLGRRVALKVLTCATAFDPRRLQRFQVEAQAAASLCHEHIVPVFGVGSDQGIHFYAMQLIDGRSLADELRDPHNDRPTVALPSTESARSCAASGDGVFELASPRPSTVYQLLGSTASFPNATGLPFCRTAARLALHVAEALEHAHSAGVIHRDIKPSNLLIDQRGSIWVTDFGLARIPHEDLSLTRTGDLVGTLRYMSPEQLRGDRVEIGPRADLYALGATLYEMLTLRPAFRGDNREDLLRRILNDEPVSPRRTNASIPKDLETIVLKSMAKEPGSRYTSARELADDLRRFLNDQPVRARRPHLGDRVARWSRRHRAALVAAVAVLLVALSVSTTLLWKAKSRTDQALARADRAVASLDRAKHAVEQVLTSYRNQSRSDRVAIERSIGAFDLVLEQMAQPPGRDDPDLGRSQESRVIYQVMLQHYDHVARSESTTDNMMAEAVAKAQRRAGRIRAILGDSEAPADFRRSIRTYENLASRHPSFVWLRTGLIETLQEYAELLEKSGEFRETECVNKRSLEVAEALLADKQIDFPCFRYALIKPFQRMAQGLRESASCRAREHELAARLSRKIDEWTPAAKGPNPPWVLPNHQPGARAVSNL